MKNFFKQIVLGFLLIFSGFVFSQLAVANEGFGSSSIVNIDKTKKIIDFGDQKFKYDKNTVVYSLQGKKFDINVLEKGMVAKAGFNPAQRYVGYPVLQSVHLKSTID